MISKFLGHFDPLFPPCLNLIYSLFITKVSIYWTPPPFEFGHSTLVELEHTRPRQNLMT